MSGQLLGLTALRFAGQDKHLDGLRSSTMHSALAALCMVLLVVMTSSNKSGALPTTSASHWKA
jgi:hypothetical protein